MSEWETIGKPKADDSGWETISAPKAAAKPPKAEPKPRATPEATPPEDPLGQGLGIPILETAASMGSGMVAKPIGDIAGLAATGWDALTGQGERAPIKGSTRPIGPEQFREDVIKGLTYEPRSAGGKMLTENNPLAWLSKLWGKGAEMAGDVVTGDPTKAGPLRTAAGQLVRSGLEEAPGVLGAKVMKGAPEVVARKQGALDITKGEQAMKDDVRQRAQRSGYITPPESGVKAAAAGLAGKAKVEKILSGKNAENATRKLGQEVGVPEGRALDEATFESLKEDAGKSYDAMTKAVGPEIQVTPKFTNAIKSTLNDVTAMIERNPETNKGMVPAQRILREWARKAEPQATPPVKERMPIERTLDKAIGEQPGPSIARTIEQASADLPHHYGSLAPPPSMPTPLPSARLSTQGTLKDIQKLRKQAKDDYRLGRGDEGDARMAVANALEGMFEDALAAKGNTTALGDFRAARTRFAKIYMLEDIVNDATGEVNLRKLASLSDRPKYKGILTGEFKTAADFAKTFTKAAQKPTGEAAPRLTVFDGLFTAGAIGSGHIGAMGAAAGELAGRLGIPAAAERGMLQNQRPPYRAMDLRTPLGATGVGVTAEQQ